MFQKLICNVCNNSGDRWQSALLAASNGCTCRCRRPGGDLAEIWQHRRAAIGLRRSHDPSIHSVDPDRRTTRVLPNRLRCKLLYLSWSPCPVFRAGAFTRDRIRRSPIPRTRTALPAFHVREHSDLARNLLLISKSAGFVFRSEYGITCSLK